MHSPVHHILHSPEHIMQSPTQQIMQSPPDGGKVFAKKRDSRQYIVINEERLISEVQRRPILYDKALKGYRKPTIREHAWQEVASMLESTVDESKKRWRSLRDAFMKQYKQFVADDPSSAKKKKWLFYDQMEFLRPYLELTHELSLSRDEYMDEYMDSTNTGIDTGTSNSNKQHLIKREYFTTSDQKGNLIIQQAPLDLADDDDLNEEALDGSSDVGGQLGGDGDVEEVEQLEEHEEVIDLYEERDIISEIFTTPGITSADSVSGGNESQEELMQQHHHHAVQQVTVQQVQQVQQQQQLQHHQQQQQQQHLLVKTCLTGVAVDQQTYQTTAQHHHQQLQSQQQQLQQQQQHHQLLPVTTSIAQLSAASNTTTNNTTTTVVLDDLKAPAQLQQQQQQHQQPQQQQQQQHHLQQPLDIGATVSPFGLDPDERFLLSCSPILKRLSHKKNALARLKMQQILYEIEFGADTMFG